MEKVGSMDLDTLKDSFTSMVGRADPSVLPAFLLWVDIKVAEYKCNGYMYSEPGSRYEGPWLRFAVDTAKYQNGGKDKHSRYGMSPDTTVQSEALELTKTPEKSQAAPKSYSPRDFSKSSHKEADQSSFSQDTACPKEQTPYKSHHSPVYGSEASGIINLSIKSQPAEEKPQESESPLKLTLKVPSVYNMSSPSKPSSAESVKQEVIGADGYSSLRTLLQTNKLAELSHPSASLLSSQLTASPIKSDTESSASSPGPVEQEAKESKPGAGTECPYCGKKFQYRSSYRRHLKIHQGVYTHICAACSRKFTRKEHFVRHKCNRKPNIPNRSASRVELTPEALPPNGKLPVPKVAFPPMMEESMLGPLAPTPEDLQPPSMIDNPYGALAFNEPVPAPILAAATAASNESRRKKSMPRKVVAAVPGEVTGDSFMADLEDDDTDLMYPSPPPINVQPKDEPMSSPYRKEEDDYMPSSLPIEVAPKEGMQADNTISTATGTYQIEEVDDDSCSDKCIKVTKQSNYLKLRKEAQLVNGQLCFVCPHCTKVFHRSSNFSRHMRIHRGIYSYICPSCNRGFYRKEHFQKHKCARKSMSRIWPRKTKIDMEMGVEKENVEEDAIEEGIPMESGEEEESGEEGSLVVDETADVSASPVPVEH